MDNTASLFCLFFAADSLGIDIPGKLPDARIDLVKKPGLFHFIPEFGAKDLGKCSDRQEKIDPRRMPETAFPVLDDFGLAPTEPGTAP